MIAIIDYGVGNLFSLRSSFGAIGQKVIVSGEREVLEKADKLILPGVGAFEDAAAKLRSSGLDRLVREKAAAGIPLTSMQPSSTKLITFLNVLFILPTSRIIICIVT